MIVFLAVAALLVAAIALFMNRPEFGRAPRGERLERIWRSPNYRDGAFRNRHATPQLTSGKGWWASISNIGVSIRSGSRSSIGANKLRSAAALRYIAVPRGTFPDVRFGRTGRCGLRSSSKLRRSGFSSAATAGTIPISPTSHASFRIWMSPCSKTASTVRIGAISTCFRPI